MLALDEMIDGGMIIECDPQQVGARELLDTDKYFFVLFCVIHFLYFFVFFSGGFKGGAES